MKRAGLILTLIAGFAGGVAFVYSCGGGSSGGAQPASGYVSASFMCGTLRFGQVYGEYYYRYTNYFDNQHANADTSVNWNGIESGTTYDDVVYVPLNLPDGAAITEFGMTAYDEVDDEFPARASLTRSFGGPGNFLTMATVETTGTSLVPQTVSTTVLEESTVVVDNSLYGYFVRANLVGGSDIAYLSAHVKYEMP